MKEWENLKTAFFFVGDWVCRETAKRRYGDDELDEISDALMKLKAFFGERPKATTAATADDQTGGTERKEREM